MGAPSGYIAFFAVFFICSAMGLRHEQTIYFYPFFGVCGLLAGTLTKRGLQNNHQKQIRAGGIIGLCLAVAMGLLFLILESSCFLFATRDEYRGSSEVFFPLLLDRELKQAVEEAGSRVALLNEYGPSEIRVVLHTMTGYGWRAILTLVLLAASLGLSISTIPILTLNWELQMQEWFPPKVFVSYSHDSDIHKQRVLDFSQQLRSDGINVSLDRYVEFPPEGWPLWMLRQIDWADYVFLVFTERYNYRCLGTEEPGFGKGVAWESTIMFNVLYGHPHFNTKFIPVVLDSEDEKWIVQPMQGFSRYRIQTLDVNVPGGYRDLYRLVTKQREVTPASVGPIRTLPPAKPITTVQQTLLPSPSSPRTHAIPIMQESELRKRLGDLLPSMFDSIVADMEAEGHILGQNASPVSRAIELVKLAKVRGELDKLIKLYLEIISPK